MYALSGAQCLYQHLVVYNLTFARVVGRDGLIWVCIHSQGGWPLVTAGGSHLLSGTITETILWIYTINLGLPSSLWLSLIMRKFPFGPFGLRKAANVLKWLWGRKKTQGGSRGENKNQMRGRPNLLSTITQSDSEWPAPKLCVMGPPHGHKQTEWSNRIQSQTEGICLLVPQKWLKWQSLFKSWSQGWPQPLTRLGL